MIRNWFILFLANIGVVISTKLRTLEGTLCSVDTVAISLARLWRNSCDVIELLQIGHILPRLFYLISGANSTNSSALRTVLLSGLFSKLKLGLYFVSHCWQVDRTGMFKMLGSVCSVSTVNVVDCWECLPGNIGTTLGAALSRSQTWSSIRLQNVITEIWRKTRSHKLSKTHEQKI
jgi:hypothetical protein